MPLDLERVLDAVQCPLPLAIALSGGADSTALLMLCVARWPGRVMALHVHHGLQPAASEFALHCEKLCAACDVPLFVARVDARHAAGQSPEEAARLARYQALADMAVANGAGAVALGHHADDQAETVLLALSRGAGLPGLAAMPQQMSRHGVQFVRPLLAVSAEAIRAWLREKGVNWIEDPSNLSLQYTRNRLRQQVLPVLNEVFPAFSQTVARSASHAAQAQQILEEVAAEELARVGDPPHIIRLQALSRARQSLVLRHWLTSQSGAGRAAYPSSAQLDALLKQVQACQTRAHKIELRVGLGRVVREGQTLRWYNNAPSPTALHIADGAGAKA